MSEIKNPSKRLFKCTHCSKQIEAEEIICNTCLEAENKRFYDEGWEEGDASGYDRGYEAGKEEGYQKGLEEGREEGREEGIQDAKAEIDRLQRRSRFHV